MTYPLTEQMRRQTPRPGRRVTRRDVIVEALRNTPLFSHAIDRDLRMVAKHAADKHVPAGKTVIAEGDRGDRFYVVVDGHVRVTRNGRKVTDLRSGKGFGELALLVDAPRTATVSTVTDTELVSFDRKTFGKLLDDSPAFARRMLESIAGRLREHDAKSVQ